MTFIDPFKRSGKSDRAQPQPYHTRRRPNESSLRSVPTTLAGYRKMLFSLSKNPLFFLGGFWG